jgi:hypothetical protein
VTGERVNLLVPAEVVPRLDVPPRALSTGAADPVWLEIGDLYLAAVPAGLAEQWIARNPGVRAVPRRPVVRRFAPRVYQVAAALALIAAVQVVIVLSVASVPAWLWLLALLFVTGGISSAYKAIPFDHVRFVP